MIGTKRVLSATQMALIIERLTEVNVQLQHQNGHFQFRTPLTLPLQWLLEATCTDVAVEQQAVELRDAA